MPFTITARERNLNAVFSDDYVFTVPHLSASLRLDA